MVKVLAIVIVGAVLFIGLPRLVIYAISKQELQECIAWKAQEQEIKEAFLARMESPWFSTDWQRSQCEQFNIYFDK